MRSIIKIDAEPVRFVADTSVRQPLMVCSHERSGTHFVMNSVANNSYFSNDPYLDYDLMPLGSFLNFYDRNAVTTLFKHLAKYHCASILKCHFAAEFLCDRSGNLMLDGMPKILYVVRNPVDVMLSYHRFINHFSSHQGPQIKRPLDFLNAAPAGQMLRYQHGQVDSILDRWKVHLLGWLKLAARNAANILVVKYQDLDENYECATKNILAFLNLEIPQVVRRPERVTKTIHVPEFHTVSVEEREQIRACIAAKLSDAEAIRALFPELYREQEMWEAACAI